MATYIINAFDNPGDDSIRSASTTWLTARAGTGSFSTNSITRVTFQWDSNGNAYPHESFNKYDTGVLNGLVIVNNYYTGYLDSGGETAPVSAQSGYDHTHPITASEWISGEQLLSSDSYVMKDQLAIASGERLTSSFDTTNLNTTGDTQVVIYDARLESADTPSSSSNLTSRVWLNSRFVIHTIQPSTLMGVHDAAVQLSDGSTAYLESDGAQQGSLKHVSTTGAITTIASDVFDWTYGTSNKIAGWPSIALQTACVVADANDNIYVIGMDASFFSLLFKGFTKTGSSWVENPRANVTAVNSPNQVSAVFCDANNGSESRGRILVAYSGWAGVMGYALVDVATILNSTGQNIPAIASGTNPSWLVSSSDFRNPSGTGLSLATDVFGGTRVGVFSWSNNALTSTSGTVIYDTRGSSLTVGTGITNVDSRGLGYQMSTSAARGGKVVGYDENKFVVVWDEGGLINFAPLDVIGMDQFLVLSDSRYFDIVCDNISKLVWIYYWNDSDNTKLMRLSYNPLNNTLDTAVEVTTDTTTGVTRDFIRTVKHLRDLRFVEVHYNRTGS